MSGDNEYIEKGGAEEQPEPKKKKQASKKKPAKKKSKKKTTALGKYIDKIDKKKVKSTFGVISILLAVYIVLSCFSYLLTWTADQDRVMGKGILRIHI